MVARSTTESADPAEAIYRVLEEYLDALRRAGVAEATIGAAIARLGRSSAALERLSQNLGDNGRGGGAGAR